MTNQIEKLIDGITSNPSKHIVQVKNKASSLSPLSKKVSFSNGIVSTLSNKTHCQTLLEKIHNQTQDHIQKLKTLRSEINTLIRQNDNSLLQISVNPFYQLFQIDKASQLQHLLSDKIFIDSLSEKISEDTPTQDLAKSMAIEIESIPILSGQDFNEKLAKTALLKALINFMSEGYTPTLNRLVTAAQRGQLSDFITSIIHKEKNMMLIIEADSQNLENDNNLLKQAKKHVNNQLRQLRKQLKTNNMDESKDTPIDMVQKASSLAESLRQSQQALIHTFTDIQLKFKGTCDLVINL